MDCPECHKELGHPKKKGQGVTYCKECDQHWFIIKLPKPKWLRKKNGKSR